VVDRPNARGTDNRCQHDLADSRLGRQMSSASGVTPANRNRSAEIFGRLFSSA